MLDNGIAISKKPKLDFLKISAMMAATFRMILKSMMLHGNFWPMGGNF